LEYGWIRLNPGCLSCKLPSAKSYKKMSFAICGVTEVPAFANYSIDHIISIRDKTQIGPDLSAFQGDFSLHRFVFDDTGDASGKHACSEGVIKRLLEIYAQIPADQNVLFHCYAGVSRSTAAAFIWLVYHGVPYPEAYQRIVSARGPFVCPNQLMIRLADKLMGKSGEMEKFMSAELGRRAPEREKYFNSFR
jgi:predicted protein tyrosine phosphatase